VKRNRTVALSGVAVAGVLAAALVTTGAADARTDDATRTVVGSWRMTIDPLPSPAGDPPAFPSFISFSRGGVVTGSSGRFPPGYTSGSVDIGAWSQTGDRTTFVFERFLSDAKGLAAIQRVTATTTVSADGHSQAGSATATVLAPDGTTVRLRFQVAASGTRMVP